MKGKLMKIECEPSCGFMVQSHDQKEMMGIGKMHAKSMHNMNVTDKDAMAMMKPAG